MSDWFYKISKGWLVIADILVFVTFGMTVLPGQSTQMETYSAGVGSPDMSFFYTPADLTHMAEAYGAEGRQAYIHARFTFDLAFPLVYTLFLITGISWLLNRLLPAANPWRKLNLIPLAAMLFDLLENICASWVMSAFPAQLNFVARAASIFTPLKWLFVGTSFALLAASAVIALYKSRMKRKVG